MSPARRGPMALLLMVLWGLVGCDGSQQAAPEERPPVEVQTALAELRRVPVERSIAGVVEPAQRAAVASRHSGTLKSLRVSEGAQVQEGQVLLEIDARGLLEAAAAAKSEQSAAAAALDQAQLNHRRMQRLYDEQLIARVRLEEAQLTEQQAASRLARAEAQVRARETELDYARLRAPFDGFVSEVLIEAGGFVAAGRPVIVMEDRSRLQVQASIGERAAAGLSPGDLLQVDSPLLDRSIQGQVASLLPVLADGGTGLRLKVMLDGAPQELQPGMVVELQVAAVDESRELVLVPAAALFSQGQLDGVFVVTEVAQGLRARLHWVQRAQDVPAGATAGDKVAVTAGLDGGEQVVIGPQRYRLADDQPVVLDGRAG